MRLRKLYRCGIRRRSHSFIYLSIFISYLFMYNINVVADDTESEILVIYPQEAEELRVNGSIKKREWGLSGESTWGGELLTFKVNVIWKKGDNSNYFECKGFNYNDKNSTFVAEIKEGWKGKTSALVHVHDFDEKPEDLVFQQIVQVPKNDVQRYPIVKENFLLDGKQPIRIKCSLIKGMKNTPRIDLYFEPEEGSGSTESKESADSHPEAKSDSTNQTSQEDQTLDTDDSTQAVRVITKDDVVPTHDTGLSPQDTEVFMEEKGTSVSETGDQVEVQTEDDFSVVQSTEQQTDINKDQPLSSAFKALGTKTALLRLLDKDDIIVKDLIWDLSEGTSKDLFDDAFNIIDSITKIQMLTQSGMCIECDKPKDDFLLSWLDCMRTVKVNNAEINDGLFVMFKIPPPKSSSDEPNFPQKPWNIYDIVYVDKKSSETFIQIPRTAPNHCTWKLVVESENGSIHHYIKDEPTIDLSISEPLHIQISTEPDAFVMVEGQGFRQNWRANKDRVCDITVPRQVGEINIRVYKPGYHYKELKKLPLDVGEIREPMIVDLRLNKISDEKITPKKISIKNENLLNNLGGSIENIEVTIKNIEGGTLMIQRLDSVCTPPPEGAHTISLSYLKSEPEDELEFFFNDVKVQNGEFSDIDVLPKMKRIKVNIDTMDSTVKTAKLILSENPIEGIPLDSDGQDGYFSIFLNFAVTETGEVESKEAALCSDEGYQSENFTLKTIDPLDPLYDPYYNTNDITACIELVPIYPKTVVVLSANSNIDEDYFRTARDALKQMEETGEADRFLIGVGYDGKFIPFNEWHEGPKLADIHDLRNELQPATKDINTRFRGNNLCGSPSNKPQVIYICKNLNIGKIPDELDVLHLISKYKEPESNTAKGIQWHKAKDQKEIINTINLLLNEVRGTTSE